jgi:hypothetical protein
MLGAQRRSQQRKDSAKKKYFIHKKEKIVCAESRKYCTN